MEPETAGVDARLVQQALDGDSAAHKKLYDRHHAQVAAMVWRLARRPEWVEDVVQETFISGFASLHRLRDPARIRAWLGVIAGRTVGKRLDRERRRRAMLDLLRISASEPPPRAGEAASLFALLDRLPSRLRSPWVLSRIEGEPLAAVAELCGCSLATVKRRIAAAQKELEGWHQP